MVDTLTFVLIIITAIGAATPIVAFIYQRQKKILAYEILSFSPLLTGNELQGRVTIQFDHLKEVENNEHYRFIKGDICDLGLVTELAKEVDVIVNFAAETHVDRSIQDPFAFIDTDVRGTYTLIQAAREAKHERYIQI